jgi:predicted DNA binding protein
MNTLATELIALLGDAKAGRANEVAIQSSMAAILTTGTFTDAQLTELQTALESGHLETIYNLN